MSELTGTFTGLAETAAAIDNTIDEQIRALQLEFQGAAAATYNGSQADVPVDQGILRGSGRIETTYAGDDFYIDVIYGDGSATPTTYSYPSSYATSAYNDGGMAAQGYAWFVELGHLTRGGSFVAPQPYLGPNFDMNANNLMSSLKGVYG